MCILSVFVFGFLSVFLFVSVCVFLSVPVFVPVLGFVYIFMRQARLALSQKATLTCYVRDALAPRISQTVTDCH